MADVEKFDGHIVCDAASQSELVVPLFKRGELLGVLDIDSTSLDRFSLEDQAGLIAVAQIYLSSVV